MRNWLRKVMTGRYGVDEFSRFLNTTAMLSLVLSVLFDNGISVFFLLVAFGSLFWNYTRMFSRNTYKRRAENNVYLTIRYNLTRKLTGLKQRMQQKKYYRFYKCPNCGAENRMEGKGTELICHSCGNEWYMDEFGQLSAKSGTTHFSHIPDWYTWQRECVRKELEDGTYLLDTDVDIAVQVNLDGVCMIGGGHLIHNLDGFHLTNNDGTLDYHQSALASHTLYSDYYWYEIGDVIGIGNNEFSYFCFPKASVSVTKARLAVEELYKLNKARKRRPAAE